MLIVDHGKRILASLGGGQSKAFVVFPAKRHGPQPACGRRDGDCLRPASLCSSDPIPLEQTPSKPQTPVRLRAGVPPRQEPANDVEQAGGDGAAQRNRDRVRRLTSSRRAEWFRGKSCAFCGSTENLELDHIDKATKIDHKVWGWREDRRLAELAKCRALCRGCHISRHTAERSKPLAHGTRNAHDSWKCRCAECLAWNAARCRRNRAARRGEARVRTPPAIGSAWHLQGDRSKVFVVTRVSREGRGWYVFGTFGSQPEVRLVEHFLRRAYQPISPAASLPPTPPPPTSEAHRDRRL